MSEKSKNKLKMYKIPSTAKHKPSKPAVFQVCQLFYLLFSF